MRRFNLVRRSALLAALVVLLLTATQAWGIVLGETDKSDFSDPGSPYFGMNGDYVGRAGVGSAVAINDRYLLSVRHFSIPLGSTVNVNGQGYIVEEVLDAPLLGDPNPPDLRLLRVRTTLPGHYELFLGSHTTGEDVVMVGTGTSGTIDTSKSTFTPYVWPSPRRWAWGTNEIESASLTTFNSGSFTSRCIEMRFNNHGTPDTPYEAGLGMHDSGGAIFVEDGDEWKVAGISAYIDRTAGPSPPYNRSYAVSVPTYASWIVTNMFDLGDLDKDFDLDADDIDEFYDYLDSIGGSGQVPTVESWFDLDSDGTVDLGDAAFLVTDIFGTAFGDFNLDGKVNATDLGILATNFGLSGLGWDSGDANGDNIINATDLGMLATNFGFEAPSHSQAQPEPTTLLVLGLGGSVLLRRRGRR